MSDGIERTRTIVREGVAVRKTVAVGDDRSATVVLAVSTERTRPATVRVSDPALESIPAGDVEFGAAGDEPEATSGDDAVDDDPDVPGEAGTAFHEDDPAIEFDGDGDDLWNEDVPAFERNFAAGESYTAGYRVAAVDDARLETLDTLPSVEVIDGDGDGDRGADGDIQREREPDDDGRNVSNTVRRLLGGSDGSSTDGAAAAASESEVRDDGATRSATDVTVGGSASEATDGGSTALAGEGSVASALLDELQNDDVDEETAAALRRELDPGASNEVRLKHLQNEVSDLAAFRELLESFVDEHGEFDEAFAELREEVAALDDGLETLRSTVEDLSATVDETCDQLDAVERDHDDLEARIEGLEADLANLEDHLDDVEAFKARLSEVF